jgi:hypothetical protein
VAFCAGHHAAVYEGGPSFTFGLVLFPVAALCCGSALPFVLAFVVCAVASHDDVRTAWFRADRSRFAHPRSPLSCVTACWLGLVRSGRQSVGRRIGGGQACSAMWKQQLVLMLRMS